MGRALRVRMLEAPPTVTLELLRRFVARLMESRRLSGRGRSSIVGRGQPSESR